MSANNDYKLSNVYSGDNLRAVARASRIDGLQNLSKDQANGQPYSRSGGAGRMIGPGWVINRPARRVFISRKAQTPWRISIISNDFGTFARINPGTINNLLPTNIFSDLSISQFGTQYVVARVTTDGQIPTNVEMIISSSPPGPPSSVLLVPPFSFDILIGVVVDLKVYQLVTNLLIVQPKVTIQTLDPNPQPGRPYLQNNYTWTTTTI